MNNEGTIRRGMPWQKLFAMFAFVLLPFGQVQANTVTSATLDGSVTDASGAAVAAASIVIVHEPTGATKAVSSTANGNFYQAGLRVGGPYRISVAAPGYEEAVLDDVYLRAGDQADFRIRLRSSSGVEEVVVLGQRIEGRDLNNGVGSFFTDEDITNQPSTQRDVIRTLLRDPLASSDGEGNLSVGGVNPRFNGLAIDGSLQQDDFGLSNNTYATSRSPINLDAVESASLVATDYSVIVSGFTGGLVNITTKSGTNEFDGSAFYYYQDQDFLGDDYDGGSIDFADFEEEEYGFTLGGPIIKDRLFFFVSYDEYETQNPVDFSRFDNDAGIEPGFFDALGDLIEDATGYAPISRPISGVTPETSERTLVKLDANINENHRASFTYQETLETGTSVGSDEFEDAWYDTPVDLEAYTVQIFSDWTPQLSTTLRFNHKDFTRGQVCRAGPDVGAIEVVDLDPADIPADSPLFGLIGEEESFTAGCDRFRHANEFEDERTQFFASADYLWGDHVTTFGAEYEDYELFNLFVPNSRGRFRFIGYDNLVNGIARVDYSNVPSNVAADGAAAWGYEKFSVFAQDVWQITPQLEVNFGLRYERFEQDDTPIADPTALTDYGVDTTANLDGLDLIQPRVGFRWDAFDRTTISGGFGLFAGGNPQVWISNAFAVPTGSDSVFDFAGADPFNVPQVLLDSVAGDAGQAVDAIADDFEIPSDWKASLRLDHNFDLRIGDIDFGDDYTFTAQYLYTTTENGFLWRNIAQTQLPTAQPTGTAPDGRVIYADLDDLRERNLTILDNFDEGQAHTITLGLQKRFDNGFEFGVNYAYQDVEITTEGTSSRGISNWRGIQTTDRNNPGAEIAPFEIEHNFTFSLGYEREFFSGLNTRVDLFGRLFKSDPFTYTFDVSSNNSLFGRAGDGERPFDNAPVYIPTSANDPLVVYASGFDQTGFFDYVNGKGIGSGINTVRGEDGNWNNIWDFQLQQELPGIPGLDRFVGENRMKLVFIVDNFLNLLNDDWGKFTNGPSNNDQDIIDADLVSAADVALNGVDGAAALEGDSMRTACVNASDCVYRFNRFFDEESFDTSPTRSVYRIRVGIRMDF